MKFIIIALFAILAVSTAAPQLRAYNPYNSNRFPLPTTARPVIQVRPVQRTDDSRNAIILRYDNDNIGVDGYSYAVETSDGQAKSEQGQVLNLGTDAETIVVRGEYSYTGPDGVLYNVRYLADDNGFQPEGAHIPKAL